MNGYRGGSWAPVILMLLMGLGFVVWLALEGGGVRRLVASAAVAALLLGAGGAQAPARHDADFRKRVSAELERLHKLNHRLRQAVGAGVPTPLRPWLQVAACESGIRPDANTGNGFYGAMQFALPSWRAVGGAGLPSEASLVEQLYRAERLQRIQGWGAWPVCARGL